MVKRNRYRAANLDKRTTKRARTMPCKLQSITYTHRHTRAITYMCVCWLTYQSAITNADLCLIACLSHADLSLRLLNLWKCKTHCCITTPSKQCALLPYIEHLCASEPFLGAIAVHEALYLTMKHCSIHARMQDSNDTKCWVCLLSHNDMSNLMAVFPTRQALHDKHNIGGAARCVLLILHDWHAASAAALASGSIQHEKDH